MRVSIAAGSHPVEARVTLPPRAPRPRLRPDSPAAIGMGHARETSVPPPRNLMLVAVGGAIGALARVGLAQAFPTPDDVFPWTTFAENVGGAFALALTLTLLAERFTGDPAVRLFLCTGALGAFTTYSTLATELVVRLTGADVLLAVIYAVASLLTGLLAAFAGMRVARRRPVARRGPR
jgi:fluoride exporter